MIATTVLLPLLLLLVGGATSSVRADLVKYGNVSFQSVVAYELANPRNVQLRLVSETGDADLYVFSWKRQIDKANINFSDYHFKSDSFGIDSILIGKDVDFPVSVVVFGVAQDDSRYALQISSAAPTELDYPTIDAAVQRSPGASYEELCLQHSFDSDELYAHEEQARQRLLFMDPYPQYGESGDRSGGGQRNDRGVGGSGVRDSPRGGGEDRDAVRGKQKQGRDRRRAQDQLHQRGGGPGEQGDSFLYHFLLWLLEFIVDVFF